MGPTPEQQAFLREHRIAVVGAIRRDGRPHLTLVNYAVEDDGTVIFSSAGDRAKIKLLRRDPRVALCVLSEEPHLRYLTVYGRVVAFVEDEQEVLQAMHRIHERTQGGPLPPEHLPALRERIRREGRVIMRIQVDEALPWRPRRTPWPPLPAG